MVEEAAAEAVPLDRLGSPTTPGTCRDRASISTIAGSSPPDST
jgi:hypothetical protein